MRDIFMLMLYPILLYGAIRKPFIAVSLWLWVALFFPSGWVYGIGKALRYNLVFSIVAILGAFFSKNRSQKSTTSFITIAISMFVFWTIITTYFCIGDKELANEFLIRFLKVIALYYCAIAILKTHLHIDVFIWAIVLSVGFYSTVEGLKLISSGGSHRIAGIQGHVLGDRNDLALAVNMTIPLSIYMFTQMQNKMLKYGLFGVIALMILCVIGTSSRGGVIGLIILAISFFKSSNNKLWIFILFFLVIFLLPFLMPAGWFDRMDTITHADSDSSFMGRVVAWKISYLIALDNPLTGGGFKALENYNIWLEHAINLNTSDELGFIPTPLADEHRSHAAHSIYFQVLGDHGFIGLILFLMILVLSFYKTSGLVNKFEQRGISSLSYLIKMLKISIVIYATAGAALSMVYFDLIYALIAIITVLDKYEEGAEQENKVLSY